MFKRFLRFFHLKNDTIERLLASNIPSQFKAVLTVNHEIDNKNNIKLPTIYGDILSQYPGSYLKAINK